MATTDKAISIGKISKNARVAGTVTEHFICTCGKEIRMYMTIRNHKMGFFARCTGCGQEGRKPSLMNLQAKKIVIEKTIWEN